MPRNTPSLVLALLFAVGCGSDELETVQVTGVVTCRGKAVPNARVTFNPQEVQGRGTQNLASPAVGVTDGEGRFTLSTYEKGDGVVVGRHAVSVSLPYEPADGTKDPNDSFPCAGRTAEVTVEPAGGEVKVEL